MVGVVNRFLGTGYTVDDIGGRVEWARNKHGDLTFVTTFAYAGMERHFTNAAAILKEDKFTGWAKDAAKWDKRQNDTGVPTFAHMVEG